MNFQLLNPELHHVAETLIRHYKRAQYRVVIEEALWEDAPYRTTLICKKSSDVIVIEVRQHIVIERYFEDFVNECIIRQEPVRIFIAIEDTGTIAIPIETSRVLKEKGIGIIIIRQNDIDEHEKAVDCSMRIRLPSNTFVSGFKYKLAEAQNKFNRGDCIDALRDLTEMVEEVVSNLAKKAAKKGKLVLTEIEITDLDLNGKINALSTPNYRRQPQKKFFGDELKNDLLSFKGARNLIHHPRTARQRAELFEQVKERMFMGARLLKRVHAKLRF